MSGQVLDFLTNGRHMTIQGGSGSDTDVVVCFKDNSGNVSATIKANGQLNLPNIPTSSAGLVSGDVWSDGGTLKIV
jgi:hypothetical protein